MKSKLLYAVLALCGTVGFVVFQVGFAGDKHITVVKENISLFNENKALRSENEALKVENAALTSMAGNKLDSFNIALRNSVNNAIDSTKVNTEAKFKNQIKTLNDELQQVKNDLHDLDGNGRRISLGPVK